MRRQTETTRKTADFGKSAERTSDNGYSRGRMAAVGDNQAVCRSAKNAQKRGTWLFSAGTWRQIGLYGPALILGLTLMVWNYRTSYRAPGTALQNELLKKANEPWVMDEVYSKGISAEALRDSFAVEDAKGLRPVRANQLIPPQELLRRCYAIGFQNDWMSADDVTVTIRIDTTGAPMSPTPPDALKIVEVTPEGLKEKVDLLECIRATAPDWYIARELRRGQVITGKLKLIYRNKMQKFLPERK